jgi:two-component system LytT family response regulator/two-component system response regulator AlgR
MRVVLADDEPLARERLARQLTDAGCEVAAEFRNGVDLLAWFRSGQSCDAVFLDIQMPGLNGLEVLGELRGGPPTVFVTAFSDHAVRAFDLAAVDYLLKPVFPDRLEQSLARLRAHQVKTLDKVDLRQLVRAPERVPVRAGVGHAFLDLKRITHFEVENNEVFAWSTGKRLPTEWNALKDVEEALPDSGMVRIQRHLLLRPEAVLALKPLMGGRASVRVGDGLDLEVSRTATPVLKAILGLG